MPSNLGARIYGYSKALDPGSHIISPETISPSHSRRFFTTSICINFDPTDQGAPTCLNLLLERHRDLESLLFGYPSFKLDDLGKLASSVSSPINSSSSDPAI